MKEYNALLGEKIDLEKAKKLLKIALEKEQLHLSEVLKSSIEIAEQNGIEIFEIITPFIEQVKNSYLSALERLPDYIDIDELQGLNASVSPDDIYTMITNKMIERIKIVSSSDYEKTWNSDKVSHGKGFLAPMNFVSGKAYRGINFLMLKDFDFFKVFDNPYFLTFKQIQKLKGKLKKGSKGHEVIYFTTLYTIHVKSSNGAIIVDFGTYNKKRFEKYIEDNWHKISPHTKVPKEYYKKQYIPIIKYYNVFNGADVEGIDFKLEDLEIGRLDTERPSDEEHLQAEGIVEHYPKPSPTISHGGDRAVYIVNKNGIMMPHKEAFKTIQDYYRTLFHELSHSTGDIKHLNREQDSFKRNPTVYSFEELIAEFGAVFLSAQAGFLWKSNKNHAAYIKGWNRHLTAAKDDNRYIMRAASAAQKSTDYILNLDKDGVPAFLKVVAKQIKEEKKQSKIKKPSNPDPTTLSQAITYAKEQANFDLENANKAQKEILENILTITKETAIKDLEYFIYELKKEKLPTLAIDLDWIVTFITEEKKAEEKKNKPKTKKKTEKKDQGIYIDFFKRYTAFLSKLEKYAIENKVGVSYRMAKKMLKEIAALAHRDEDYAKTAIDYFKKSHSTTLLDLLNKIDYDSSDLDQFNGYVVIDAASVYADRRAKKKVTPKGKSQVIKFDTMQKRVDLLYEFGQSSINEKTADGAIKVLSVKLPKKGNLIAPTRADIIVSLANEGKFLEIEEDYEDYIFWENGKARTLARKATKTEYLFSQFLKKKLGKATKTKETPSSIRPRRKKNPKEGPGQLALFGAKAKSKKRSKLSGVTNILADSDVANEFFTIPGAVGEFLQQVEKKPVHSVVITLDGAQGAGKTTTMYRFIDSFASAKKPCVFFSLEEHPQSHLAREKASEYIDAANVPYVDSVGDLDSKEQFYEIVDQYDFIFIDSWQKLLRAIGNIRLDEDLRKRFHGKVFVIIFQQTTTGRTKGGAEIVFDGDIIIKMIKEARFADNYAYMDKNRYTLRPIDELRYNIAGDYTYSTVEGEEQEMFDVPSITEELAYTFEIE